MATRGTEFIGTELLKQVAGNYDRRIAEHEEELNSINALSTAERHAAWRVSAERAVLDLAEAIRHGWVSDAELSHFSIPSPPYPGELKYKIQSHEGQIKALLQAKEKALAYISSLAADKGVVTLSAADLRRIGYQP